MLFSQCSSISIVIIAVLMKKLQRKISLKRCNLFRYFRFCYLNIVLESWEFQSISGGVSPGETYVCNSYYMCIFKCNF